jgi:flavodoxin I
MSKVGLFFGTQTGTTQDIAERIQAALGGDGAVDLYDISGAEVSDFEKYDCIIVGCPTWDIGELQSDWESFYEDELNQINFSGKKIAYFGAGDQYGYADNFQDAIGILEEKITSLGGKTVGYWSTDSYEFDESRAVRNGKFVGLAIDETNQSELTNERIDAWTAQIKQEFGL